MCLFFFSFPVTKLWCGNPNVGAGLIFIFFKFYFRRDGSTIESRAVAFGRANSRFNKYGKIYVAVYIHNTHSNKIIQTCTNNAFTASR